MWKLGCGCRGQVQPPPVSYIQFHKTLSYYRSQSLSLWAIHILGLPSKDCAFKVEKCSRWQRSELMSRHFLEFKLHLLSFENQINKVEGTKAWGKSPFVTYTDAYTSTYYLDMYTFLKSIYASLNFHMCLQNMTPPKFLWVLCCVRYDKIVFQFFCFFFVFSVFVALFFFYLFFFSFPPKMYFIKKKRNKIYIKKRNSWFFFVGCKFPPDKRGRTTGQTQTQGQGQTDQLAYKHKL